MKYARESNTWDFEDFLCKRITKRIGIPYPYLMIALRELLCRGEIEIVKSSAGVMYKLRKEAKHEP